MQAVMLPYKSWNRYMVILLPQKNKSLKDIEKHLSAAGFAALQNHFKETHVNVKIPEFHIENQFSLSRHLRSLGMSTVFEPDLGNFPGIAEGSMALGEAFHSTYMQVDKYGTEAAAVTALVGGVYGGSLLTEAREPVIYTADHPFVFLIYDYHAGAILFMGHFKE